MDMKLLDKNNVKIAVIKGNKFIITDVQSALDLIATVRYEADCDRIAISKSVVTEDFFLLSTGMAGEIIQKFVNYYCKIAIFGDFSHYTSKSFHDFIYESNKGSHAFFVGTEGEAVIKLTNA